MTDQGREIRRAYDRINDERRKKMHEAMCAYDETVFRPALVELQSRCGAIGHSRGPFHDNGLGWCWYWCNNCGAAFDKIGPEND